MNFKGLRVTWPGSAGYSKNTEFQHAMKAILQVTTMGWLATVSVFSGQYPAQAQISTLDFIDTPWPFQTEDGVLGQPQSIPERSGPAETNASGPAEPSTVSLAHRFTTVLQALGIPILQRHCEAGLMGSYNYARNEITLCQNNLKKDSESYLTTLAHESWHVIQDHATGLDNVLIAPVTWSTNEPENLEAMRASLDLNRMQTILNRYDGEDYAFEVEAYVMEEHPETVLRILEALVDL
jgi:hypothetical protein